LELDIHFNMSKIKKSLSLKDVLVSLFPHQPTQGQNVAIDNFEQLLSPNATAQIMLLKGYAGTGKTTLVKAVADTAKTLKIPIVLLSPTGRGAKVMTDITGHDAFTIHKHIYDFEMKPNGSAVFKMSFNKLANALFIIDEASMIQGGSGSNSSSFFISEKSLLRDLLDFINNGKKNKIIIIGDPAQLPPVNHDTSPALDENHIAAEFEVHPLCVTLTDIVRQAKNSGILMNATAVRKHIENSILQWPELNTSDYKDITKLESWQIQDMIQDSFGYKHSDSVIITVSNKLANKYNEFIRSTVLQKENIIDAGDLIMAVKNNYFWLDSSGSDFIANGEMMEVMSVRNFEQKYGFQFADVSVKMLYQKNEPVIDMKILLDILHMPAPALPHEQFMKLWNFILLEKGGKLTKKKSLEILKEDPYVNALQVKFAWALTCHKAQGGQWKKVFIDTEFLMKRTPDMAGLRWLYTALTRASEELHILR